MKRMTAVCLAAMLGFAAPAFAADAVKTGGAKPNDAASAARPSGAIGHVATAPGSVARKGTPAKSSGAKNTHKPGASSKPAKAEKPVAKHKVSH